VIVARLAFFASAVAVSASGVLATELVPKQVAVGNFGACIARMAPQQSKRLMETEPESKEERKLLQAIVNANSSCLTKFSSLSMKSDDIRGAIAENLILMDEPRMAKIAAIAPKPPVRAAADKDIQFLLGFAACIAQSDPQKSLALLRTEYRSVKEKQAIVALESLLVNCIPETVEYALNVPELRSHLAMATYALSEKNMSRETK
jgi:hypothetical protein